MSGTGPIVTMPGKMGDAVFAMNVVRSLVALYGEPCTFITSEYCRPIVPLIAEQTDLVDRVIVADGYKPESMDPGVQPWAMGIREFGPGPRHRDVIQLGLRRRPLPGENIVDLIGMPYRMRARPGPWLKRCKPDPTGPVIAHAPVKGKLLESRTVNRFADLMRRTSEEGRRILMIGTFAELDYYQAAKFHEIPGVTLREVADYLEIAKLCDGASMFRGVDSGPGVVAAAVGLPCEWIVRLDERWIPPGCEVTSVV